MAQSSIMLAHARLEKQWKDPRKLYQDHRGEGGLIQDEWNGLRNNRGEESLKKRFKDDDSFTG
jgi:hypothetical protein